MRDSEDVVMPFGKHKGRTLGQIGDEDILYLDWLNGLDNLRPPLREAVADVCERRQHEIESAMADDWRNDD